MVSTVPKLLGMVILYPNFMTSNQPFSAKGILKFAQLTQATEYSDGGQKPQNSIHIWPKKLNN